MKVNINDVVMIKGEEKNRAKWKIENIFMGKHNTIRSVKIRTGKSLIERTIQLPYPVELHCHSNTTISNTQDDKASNVNAEEFRPQRSAAAIAE